MRRFRGLGGRSFSRVSLRFDQLRGVWGPGWRPKTVSSDQRRPTRRHEACRAMFPPPDSTDRSGCTPRRGVHGQALDQGRPFGPPHQTVGLSTAGAVPPRRPSIRWSSSILRRSSHRPPRGTPWATASPRGSSATSGPTCVAAFWRTASLAPAAPAVVTISWSRSVARAAAYHFLLNFKAKRSILAASSNRRNPLVHFVSLRKR